MKASFVVISLFVFVFLARPVSAHVLESHDPIGAVMHIQPDDDPVAGEESIFFFEFKDKDNVFVPADCDCTFRVLQNDKERYSQPISLSNWDEKLKNVSVAYTFPEKGEYTVRIVGKPLHEESFEAFTLSYDVRITKAQEKVSAVKSPQEKQSSNVLPFVSVGVVVCVVVMSFVYARRRKK